jgi:Toprim domain
MAVNRALAFDELVAATGNKLGIFGVPCVLCSPFRRKKHLRCMTVWREGPDFIGYNCNHCGAHGSVAALGRHTTSERLQCLRSAAIQLNALRHRHRRNVAQGVWAKSLGGPGSLGDIYLASRGIKIPRWPATLRFLPASPPAYPWPALVAAFGVPSEVEPSVLCIEERNVVGIQLTYIRHDGSGKAPVKPNKLTVGSGHHMPIVLAPPNDNLGLIVAEGIEDALSAHAATGLGAWAAAGAGRMARMAEMVPIYIDQVTVIADDNEVGLKGAMGLSARLRDRGISAEIKLLKCEG